MEGPLNLPQVCWTLSIGSHPRGGQCQWARDNVESVIYLIAFNLIEK